MNNTPKVSVIVPVYKVEKYLCQCIESVLKQSFTDFELLLVDDGSPDSCGRICDEYAVKDSRIRVFHKENGGVSSARNLGLDNACGEWILFVDSDDWIEPWHLASYVGAGDCDMIFSGYKSVDCLAGNPIEVFKFESIFAETERVRMDAISKLCNYDFRSFSSTWSKIFKRSIIESAHLRFKEDICNAEDRIFTTAYLGYAQNLRILSGSSYNYRLTENSLQRGKYRKPETVFKYANYFREEFTKLPLTPELKELMEYYSSRDFLTLGRMIYYPLKLKWSFSERRKYLSCVIAQRKNFPIEPLESFCFGNEFTTDCYRLLKYFVRTSLELLKKFLGKPSRIE